MNSRRVSKATSEEERRGVVETGEPPNPFRMAPAMPEF